MVLHAARLDLCGRRMDGYVDDERRPWYPMVEVGAALGLTGLDMVVNMPDVPSACRGVADGAPVISAEGVRRFVKMFPGRMIVRRGRVLASVAAQERALRGGSDVPDYRTMVRDLERVTGTADGESLVRALWLRARAAGEVR